MPRLVLVSAPAGFGKTTLIAQWLASSQYGGESEPAGQSALVAWLSLDAEDSELGRFLTHLVAAIQTSSPQVGARIMSLSAQGIDYLQAAAQPARLFCQRPLTTMSSSPSPDGGSKLSR